MRSDSKVPVLPVVPPDLWAALVLFTGIANLPTSTTGEVPREHVKRIDPPKGSLANPVKAKSHHTNDTVDVCIKNAPNQISLDWMFNMFKLHTTQEWFATPGTLLEDLRKVSAYVAKKPDGGWVRLLAISKYLLTDASTQHATKIFFHLVAKLGYLPFLTVIRREVTTQVLYVRARCPLWNCMLSVSLLPGPDTRQFRDPLQQL